MQSTVLVSQGIKVNKAKLCHSKGWSIWVGGGGEGTERHRTIRRGRGKNPSCKLVAAVGVKVF